MASNPPLARQTLIRGVLHRGEDLGSYRRREPKPWVALGSPFTSGTGRVEHESTGVVVDVKVGIVGVGIRTKVVVAIARARARAVVVVVISITRAMAVGVVVRAGVVAGDGFIAVAEVRSPTSSVGGVRCLSSGVTRTRYDAKTGTL